jgi:hypothetical protein
MVDFDEFIVMREETLEELNIVIEKVIEEKESMDLDYDLLEKVLEAMIKSVRNAEVGQISVVTPIKKEEMLQVTLNFFKSIDSELYRKAINTILQQSKNIKTRIYNIHQVKNDFDQEDNLGLSEYTRHGCVQSRNGFATVNIPIRGEIEEEEEVVLNKDEGTLNDLYVVVHEISHLFDLDLDSERTEILGKTRGQKTEITRELLGEATASAFEGMLTEYLLKNKIYSQEAIQEMDKLNINSYLKDAILVYAKLLLAKEKSKNGEIKMKFIEKFMRENGFSLKYIRYMTKRIINDPRNMLFEKRYALGGLISPTIIKKYNEEGANTLKKYLEEAKNGNLVGALAALGIELNENGINQLISNMQDRVANMNTEKDRI